MSNFDSWYLLLLLRRDKQALYLVEQLENDCFVRAVFRNAKELDLKYSEFLEYLAVEQTRRNQVFIELEIARQLASPIRIIDGKEWIK